MAGDRTFAAVHGCRFPYVVGEMARGIATAEMVIASASAGLMAFFGSAGLRIDEVAEGLTTIRNALGPEVRSWGMNLIHTPQEPDGGIRRRTNIFAKVSRVEVARAFLSPAPDAMLHTLVEQGRLTSEEAELARQLPVAADITVETDSGGHTENRPLSVLLDGHRAGP